MKTRTILLTVPIAVALAAHAFGQITKTERFNSETAAKANGWVELGSRANGMDYGFSAGTGYAGGGAGEAGGKVGRNQVRSEYADTFGSFLNLSVPLQATGRLAIVFQNGNASVVVGHSDSTRIGLNQDTLATIGFRTVPSTRTLEAVVGLTNVVRTLAVLNATMDVGGFTNYLWSYSWNPSGGTASTGALTVAISDSFGGASTFTNTVTLSISAADRNQNPRFDSFGWTTRALGATAVYAQTYMDDVQYTALPACIRLAPASLLADPGQTNKTITITIPAAANIANDVHLTVTSSAPAVAEPLGATAGSLELTFPMGGPTTQSFYVSGVGAGNANLVFASTNAVCFATNVVTVTVATTLATVMKAEPFDTPAYAGTNGWSELGTRSGGHDFGFSTSTNAGGPAGEAGGFARRTTTRASYADVFSSPMTLNDRLQGSGILIFPSVPRTNAGPLIGHADSTKIGLATEANFLGLEGVYTVAGVPEVRARLVLATGTSYEPVGPLSPAAIGTVYYWDYFYDPTGGADGNGALTVNISDGVSLITNTTVIELTASDRASGAQFDSFGMTSRSLASSTNGTTLFMDDVHYTALAVSPCARFVGAPSLTMVVGQTNRLISLAIPSAANALSDFHLFLTSQQPAIAAPAGAGVGGTLDVVFPVGAPLVQTVFVNATAAGTALFQVSSTNSVCTATNLLSLVVPCSSVTTAHTETFDTADSAASHGWVELGSRTNGQDYGFSPTASAGGPGGEGGGTFKRDNIRSCYVEVFKGRLTLNDRLTASGRLIVPGLHGGNLGPNIGHSDSTKAGLSTAVLGETLAEANNIALNIVSGASFVPELILADGGRRGETVFMSGISTNTVYDWYYSYDPTGGPSGDGSLTTAVITGGVTNIGVYNLTAADRAIGATFDSFGLTSRALASSAATGPAFIDGLSYTAPVALRITGVTVLGNGNLRLAITTPRPCGTHLIQQSTSLSTPAWSTVTNVAFGTLNDQATAEFAAPTSTRFYRAVLQ